VQLVLLGLFLAMTLSLIVAFILDAIDQTIKTPRDVENYLRSPVIFSIEQIKKES
jgi:capsular polysaccharide biosynthesis protein